MKVAVIGLGYVGLPLALLADQKGYEVVGFDTDAKKVELINSKQSPLVDELVEAQLENTKMTATTDTKSLAEFDIVIVCVPTPVNGIEPDLRPLKGAVINAAPFIKKDALLLIESTINPGVCDEVLIPLIKDVASIESGKDYYIAHCPERINPGDPKWNVSNINRVIGSDSKTGLEKAVAFYSSILDADIKPMHNLKEAEAVKVVENSFRDINIAFVNELAKSFTKLNINVKNVIEGAATKPFAFMPHYPSLGVGGHCIPVDPYYLIEYARGYGFNHEFLSLARSINNSMPAFTVEQLTDALNELELSVNDLSVLVLGVSYKANVADDRESPSYPLIQLLKEKKANVSVFDPYFPAASTVSSIEQGLKSTDAVILASDHTEFLSFDFTPFNLKVFIDGKNKFDRTKLHKSTLYRGIGVR